jgi:hypothetical protein
MKGKIANKMQTIVWNGHSVVLMFNEFGSTKELLHS